MRNSFSFEADAGEIGFDGPSLSSSDIERLTCRKRRRRSAMVEPQDEEMRKERKDDGAFQALLSFRDGKDKSSGAASAVAAQTTGRRRIIRTTTTAKRANSILDAAAAAATTGIASKNRPARSHTRIIHRFNDSSGSRSVVVGSAAAQTTAVAASDRLRLRTPLVTVTVIMILLLGSFIDVSSAFHSIRNRQQQPQHSQQQQIQHRQSSRVFMSLATPPSSTSTGLPDKTELESMKVVDLKQLIKDSGLNERGLLSKLKRKQDLVDFLAAESSPSSTPANLSRTVVVAPTTPAAQPTPVQRQLQQQHDEGHGQSNSQQQQQPMRKKSRITMPKKKPSPTGASRQPQTPNEQQQQQQHLDGQKQRLSPVQVLFDKVYEQYPTLEYMVEGNNTLLGELDIRQRYHPMLKAGNQQAIPKTNGEGTTGDEIATGGEPSGKKSFKPALSGDMDLIFVGTASCTPSITRGVSCTALRLHSLAASASGGNSSDKNKNKNVNIDNTKKGSLQRFDVASASSSNLGTWLFDCGESTQLQIQKTSSVRPSKITKIFLTHAHGDHSFGLPGLLCLMGQDTAGGNEAGERGPNGENIRKTKESKVPIEIYGPEGLRLWLRTAIRYSVSRIVPRYRVHELKDVAMAPEWGYSPKWEKYFFNKQAYFDLRKHGEDSNSNSQYYWGAANDRRKESQNHPKRRGQTTDWMSLCEMGVPGIERSELYGEVEGGRDIYPIYDHPRSAHGAPVWEVEHEGGDITDGSSENKGVRVYAGPMSHGVPCVGYVVEEADRPGRLRSELVTPICKRNIAALKEAGFRHPMKALAVIKDLPEGGSFTFPDGTVVRQEDAVEPTRPGRKIVICGDTNSAKGLEGLAKDADVVIHEATNTFLQDRNNDSSSFHGVNREAIYHGHSTPHIAGDFAKRVGAKRLILNHFSARYMGDQSVESISIMTRIEQQAMKASGLSRSHVAAAWDFMIFPVPKAYDKHSSSNNNNEEEEEATAH